MNIVIRSVAVRKVVFAVIPALVIALSSLLVVPSANALGKVKCDVDGTPTITTGNYDPIVNHNQASSMHEHQFFGNIAWLTNLTNPNTANLSDLVDQSNNCRKVLGLSTSVDSAGYWTPTLRYSSGPHAGELIPASQFTAYYRSFDHNTFGDGAPIPHGARLVSEPGHYNWTCGQNSGTRSAPVMSIPDCTGLSGKPGLTLTAHIDFPSCWDGQAIEHSADQVGDTRDNSHFAYYSKVKGKITCPAAYPVKVTELREAIQFDYQGNGSDVVLSSDAMAGTTGGKSLHGDFYSAWNEQGFADFIATCVNKAPGTTYTTKSCDP